MVLGSLIFIWRRDVIELSPLFFSADKAWGEMFEFFLLFLFHASSFSHRQLVEDCLRRQALQ